MKSYPKNNPKRLKGKELGKRYGDVFIRDNHTCQSPWCNSHNLDSAPHHIIHKSQGGSDDLWNLITLCIDCHRRTHGSKNIITIDHQPEIPIKEMMIFQGNPIDYLIFNKLGGRHER
jgi:hypothetical protein